MPITAHFALLTALLVATSATASEKPIFTLPVACTLGKTCFVQQYADMDPGSLARDPFCEGATYDGHKGTDFRVPHWTDAQTGVDVVAAMAGTVRVTRNTMSDKITRSTSDRNAVNNVECGNGVLIDHGGNWESQYCHLKQGSISVVQGQTIKQGDILGLIGASGDAAFPHVHFSLRHSGTEIDPFTAVMLNDKPQCTKRDDLSASLWSAAAQEALNMPALQLIGSGLADGTVRHSTLVDAAPAQPNLQSDTLVGWAWLINLEKNDIVQLTLTAPDGRVFAENQSDPVDSNKADYSLFAGRKRTPLAGDYVLTVNVIRQGNKVLSQQDVHTVR